jgi:D-alanyl-D-alanine carboxypeptidase (penicillin-binding protein 5/6)
VLTALCLLVAAPAAAFASEPVPPAGTEDGQGADPGLDPWQPEEPDFPDELPDIKTVKAPTAAKAALAIDAETAEVYSSRNESDPLPVASVSKLMTVWLVMEKISKASGSLSDTVTIRSKNIERLSRDSVCGGYVLKRGAKFTVRQLLQLTLVSSSNAATVQLGTYVGGTYKNFVKLMNKEAAKLDLVNSGFTSSCGLNNADMRRFGLMVSGGASGTNIMSAEDVGELARVLIEKYPNVLDYSKISAVKIKDKWIGSTNRLLTNSSLKSKAKAYAIDGLKTGYTRRAGSCLVSTGKADGMHRLITVFLNDTGRFDHTISLFKNIYAKNPVRLADEPPAPEPEPVYPDPAYPDPSYPDPTYPDSAYPPLQKAS